MGAYVFKDSGRSAGGTEGKKDAPGRKKK